jgi:transcriptional regulator with XRE-family HTH domain
MVYRVTEKPAWPMPADRPDAEKRAGQQLRLLRTGRGWALREVAERMKAYGYNWHQTIVAKTETGQRPLRLNEALDLASLFGVSLTSLLAPTGGAESLDEMRAEAAVLRSALEDAGQQAQAAQIEAAQAAMDSAVATAAVESWRSRIQLLDELIAKLEAEKGREDG